jgi:hypothetical protein
MARFCQLGRLLPTDEEEDLDLARLVVAEMDKVQAEIDAIILRTERRRA